MSFFLGERMAFLDPPKGIFVLVFFNIQMQTKDTKIRTSDK